MVQSIEDGNREEPSAPRPGWLRPDPLRNLVPNPLVWLRRVEVADVFLDYPMKVPVPDNQQVIEAFSPQAPQEPFADRVGLQSAKGRPQDLAGAAVDRTQLAGVGNQDLMPKLLEQAPGPTRVGAGLHGYPAGWQTGELAPEGRFGGGDADFFDEFALGIQRR
jgi:hypothetical protein